jgi:hypothetical protein
MDRQVFTTAASCLVLIFAAASAATGKDGKRNEISFDMVVSAGAKTVFRAPGRASSWCRRERPKT